MKRILSLLTICLAMAFLQASAQDIVANIAGNSISVKKQGNTDIVIPLGIELVNTTGSVKPTALTVSIDNTTAPPEHRVIPTDASTMRIIYDATATNLNPNEIKKTSMYLVILRSAPILNDKIVYLTIMSGGVPLGTIKVTIQPEDKLLTLDEYFAKGAAPVNKLDHVTNVASVDNIMTISGYKKVDIGGTKRDVFTRRTVELKSGEVFSVFEWNYVRYVSHWSPLPLSLITVPFKIRPQIVVDGITHSVSSTSGISNLGFNLDLARAQWDRYFSTGKKSTHKLSFGVYAAPSIEELDSASTKGANGLIGTLPGKMASSKQFFISTGLTFSYSYNDISFVFVPMGYDLATSTIGKSWIYKKKRWWGFGIAISPKIFATILNK